jgi:hypothetical protein
LAFQDFILLVNGFYQLIYFLLLFHGKVCKKRRQIIIIFTRATLIIKSSIFGGVSRVYLLFALLGYDTLVDDIGEEGPLLMAMLAVSSSEESVELSLESHSFHMCASSPFFLW